MSLDKISLTLFDVLGYLLPGYILLFACSVLEATFSDSRILALSSLNSNLVVSSVIAYFLGQIGHRMAAWVHNKQFKWFDNSEQRLSDLLYYHARSSLVAALGLELEEGQKVSSLETYMLAESYLIASGSTAERDSLVAREGFHKTAMASFALTTLVFLLSLISGGAKINITPETSITLGAIGAFLLAFLALVVTLIFRRGFMFYNRLKINNILLLAATLVKRDGNKANG
jgi:membrane protein DedA with SNARE-associated domain